MKHSMYENLLSVIANHKKVIPDFNLVLKKPATAKYIFLTNIKTSILHLAYLLVLIFIIPIVVDFITEFLFPPDTSKKLFGLIENQKTNPLKSIADIIIMTLAWVISVVSILSYYWLNIPKALELANHKARNLIEPLNNIQDETDKTCIQQNQQTDTSATFFEKSTTNIQGRYTIGKELGKGAMGVVYEAWDTVLERKIAIKQLSRVLSGDDEYIIRFRQEAKALAKLTHQNIVQVYDFIEESEHLWMTLEFVGGGDLTTHVNKSGRCCVTETINIMIPVLQGLAYAHTNGIIHRDLKPANILLTKDNIPKITDFGIAKISQSGELTQAGTIMGSPKYMSPEQCAGGSVDARADIYALGITMYELLSGKVPFEGDTSSIMAKHITEQPGIISESVEGIPKEIDDLLAKMLAKKPEERISDIQSIIEILLYVKQTLYSSEHSIAHM